MNRCSEHFELLHVNSKPNFFVTHCDIPYKVVDYTVDHYVRQMRKRFLDVLTEKYGVDTSDAAIRKAAEEHNEVCRILTEIGDFRKLDNPPLTGYEYHILNLVSYCCPKYLILPYLRETLEEIRTRVPDPKPWFRARVAIVGSEIDDPSLTKLVEEAGAMVRVSSESNQEQVRVAKSALKSGITFARVGAAYIQKYRELPGVRHVRLIFATDPPALKELIANARQVDAITKTLTHILDGLPTDCGHCTLKPVCDEVEGMRELHMSAPDLLR